MEHLQLFTYHHIYITNDEKIKEGNWYYYKEAEKYEHIFNYAIGSEDNTALKGKKIILTTDEDLIKNGVQAIDDEFLKWFIKNPTREEVRIKNNICLVKRGNCDCSEMDMDCQVLGYEIIIPEEESNYNLKQEILLEMERLETSKPETLEEAAKKYATNHGMMAYISPEKQKSFIAGAKWQSERMYSEEEAYAIWTAGQEYWKTSGESKTFEEFIEQFKKK